MSMSKGELVAAALVKVSLAIQPLEKGEMAVDILYLLNQLQEPTEKRDMPLIIEIAARYGIDWTGP